MAPVGSLADKVVAVTGASSGVGRAVCEALAARGARVIGFARRFSASGLEAMPGPGQLVEVSLDVTRETDVAARFGELSSLDALILSHGDATFTPVAETTAAEVRAMLESHVVGSFSCIKAAQPLLAASQAGQVIAVESVAAENAFFACGGYTAAKAGQLGLLRVFAEEGRAQGIRVTNLLLGAVDTPIWDGREGFDRTKMMRPAKVAALIADLLLHPELGVDKLTVAPPGGNL